MSLIFSLIGLPVSNMGKLRFVRAWPTAAFVVAAALLASMLVASPAASAAPTVFVCDNEDDMQQKVTVGEGTDAKHARIVITRIDPLLGEVRHSSTVVQYRLPPDSKGHRAPDPARPHVTGSYLEQAKRSAENHWGTVEVHCSETAFKTTEKQYPNEVETCFPIVNGVKSDTPLPRCRLVIDTNGDGEPDEDENDLADGIVRIAIGVTWLVDCAASDFKVGGNGGLSGPLADYDTIKVCGNHYGRGSKVQVNRNTGEFTCKDPDFTGVPNCTTPVQPPTTTTVQPQVAGGSANGGKQGSGAGAGDIGALRAPGSPSDGGPSTPGETPRPLPEASSDGGSTFGGYVEPEPEPEPVSLLGGGTTGGYIEPDPPPTTTTAPPAEPKKRKDCSAERAAFNAAAAAYAAEASDTNWPDPGPMHAAQATFRACFSS